MTTRGSEPYTVVVHPSGRYVYVVASHDQKFSPICDRDGWRAHPVGPSRIDGIWALDHYDHPPGGFAYVSNYSDSDSTVSQYSIGADGSLNPMNSPTVVIGSGRQPFGITIDPAGKYRLCGRLWRLSEATYPPYPCYQRRDPAIRHWRGRFSHCHRRGTRDRDLNLTRS